jgi:hypothetical protein
MYQNKHISNIFEIFGRSRVGERISVFLAYPSKHPGAKVARL